MAIELSTEIKQLVDRANFAHLATSCRMDRHILIRFGSREREIESSFARVKKL